MDGNLYNLSTMKTRSTGRLIRRVDADSPEALVEAVADVERDGVPRVLERNGRDVAAVVALSEIGGINPKKPTEAEIAHAFEAAGSWTDVDGAALKQRIYRARRSGTRSADRRRRL
jgi:hypothetical protein